MPWLTAMAAVALIYDGVVFYSRWSGERNAERTKSSEEAEQARKTLEMLGGDGLRITAFYASPGVIRRGSHATICYGVSGAKLVRIEPAVEEIRPAVNHCLQVTPRKDTEYKLTAEDAAGHSVSQSFVLRVAR